MERIFKGKEEMYANTTNKREYILLKKLWNLYRVVCDVKYTNPTTTTSLEVIENSDFRFERFGDAVMGNQIKYTFYTKNGIGLSIINTIGLE